MSTYGSTTRTLFEASVTVKRSFEDYGYVPTVEEQVNEPTLKIRVNRLELSITKRINRNKPGITKIDNRSYYGWLGRYFVDLYIEAPYREDEPYYMSGSGDWSRHHGEMIK